MIRNPNKLFKQQIEQEKTDFHFLKLRMMELQQELNISPEEARYVFDYLGGSVKLGRVYLSRLEAVLKLKQECGVLY